MITTSGTTTTIPGITYSYSYGPYPSRTAPGPDETDDPVPPPPTGCDVCPPIITPRIGPPGPICESECGDLCDNICSPGFPCLNLLGCGCIGLGCPQPGCIGPGCVIGPPPPGGGGGGGEGGEKIANPKSIHSPLMIPAQMAKILPHALPASRPQTALSVARCFQKTRLTPRHATQRLAQTM